MNVRVKFFGLATFMPERSVRTVELPDGATVGQLLALVIEGDEMILKATTILVNKEEAGPETVLAEGDEVIFMVRFAGG